jgi:hypothetical protein
MTSAFLPCTCTILTTSLVATLADSSKLFGGCAQRQHDVVLEKGTPRKTMWYGKRSYKDGTGQRSCLQQQHMMRSAQRER